MLDDTSQPSHRHYSVNRAVNDEEFVEQQPQHNLVVSYEKINSIVDNINDSDSENGDEESSEYFYSRGKLNEKYIIFEKIYNSISHSYKLIFVNKINLK